MGLDFFSRVTEVFVFRFLSRGTKFLKGSPWFSSRGTKVIEPPSFSGKVGVYKVGSGFVRGTKLFHSPPFPSRGTKVFKLLSFSSSETKLFKAHPFSSCKSRKWV